MAGRSSAARSQRRFADVQAAALALFVKALVTALLLTLPLVGAVALIGVLMGVAQTIFQVQDQNVAFFPKLLGVAALAIVAGVPAAALLRALMLAAIASIPRFVGG